MKTGNNNKTAADLVNETENLKYLISIGIIYLPGEHKGDPDIISFHSRILKDALGLYKILYHQKENISAVNKNSQEIVSSLPVKGKVNPVTGNYIPELYKSFLASVKYFQDKLKSFLASVKDFLDKLKSFPVSFRHSGACQGHSGLFTRSPLTYTGIIPDTSGGIPEVVAGLPELLKSFLQKVKTFSKSSKLFLMFINTLSVYCRGMFVRVRETIPEFRETFNKLRNTFIKFKNITVLVRRFPVFHKSFFMKHGEIEKVCFY